MRSALALALLAVPAMAYADDDVWQNTVYTTPDPSASPVARAGMAAGSHLLYVNTCRPGGCTVTRGGDDSRTDHSSIAANQTSQFAPWGDSQATVDAVMACIRDKMAMYDVQITTDDPGSNPHWEIMAAGTAGDLNPQLIGKAGGIAPFIDCSHTRNNGLGFVFANDAAGQVTYLCTAIIHEAGHMWGLEHNLEDRDHMSYQRLGQAKDWTNSDTRCGEMANTPRQCSCSNTTVNSFRNLQGEFGLATGIEPITATITKPTDGAWVKAGFGLAGAMTSPLMRLSAAMKVDDTEVGHLGDDGLGVLAFNAPADLTPGDHVVTLTGIDYGDRSATATATVHVLGSCTAAADCAAGTQCLGGTCYPDAETTGGLGATCEASSDCSTNVCGTLNGVSHCTASCDAGEVCPDGFECRGGATGVCWEKGAAANGSDDGGGCATGGGNGGGPLALFGVGLGALALMGRRRRARR